MPFQKGHPKIGGRQAGTPNVLTKELRTEIKELVSAEIAHIKANISTMTDSDRRQVLKVLLPYAMPQTKPVSYYSLEDSEQW
jgi:hypothetical protein